MTTLVFGQATDGNMVGTIMDATGAAVPGATVTITNTATGIKYVSKSGSLGEYRFNNVPSGSYDVSATASGFSTATLKDVTVNLNATITANLTMQVGQLTTTIEVSEGAVTIDTTTAQLQSSFGFAPGREPADHREFQRAVRGAATVAAERRRHQQRRRGPGHRAIGGRPAAR